MADLENRYFGPPLNYREPRRAPLGGMPGQFAGPSNGPLAEALAGWGVNADSGIMASLARQAAPVVSGAERVLGQVPPMAAEMTGIPSAMRAGEQAAAGHYPQAAGEALMALPSRVAGIVGFPLATAEAGEPDPRVTRIDQLNKEIAGHRKRLEEMAKVNFRSTKARSDASQPYLDAITKAQGEAAKLQDAINAEFQAKRDAELAAERGAQWANTPFAKKYPGAPAGIAGLGMLGSVAFPALRGRRAVTAFERDAQSLSGRVKAAVDRANDTSLDPRLRTQAANEARQLQAQYQTLRQAGPATGGHGRAFIEGAVPTEAAIAAPSVIDYLSSTPQSELRDYTLESNNPVSHPGEVLGRYGLGLGFGGVLGELGHIVSDRLADPGADYAGEVNALNKRYSAPRKAPSRRRK